MISLEMIKGVINDKISELESIISLWEKLVNVTEITLKKK